MRKIAVIAFAFLATSCNSSNSIEWFCKSAASKSSGTKFTIWCPAQGADYFIPTKYGCPPKGDGVAPPISWKDVPEEATHLRIAVVDTMCAHGCDDCCMHVHWQLDLPLKEIVSSEALSANAIAEGVDKDTSIVALTLPNSEGKRVYSPFCVPEFQTHSIVLKALAYRLDGSKRIVLGKAQSEPLLFSFDAKSSAAALRETP